MAEARKTFKYVDLSGYGFSGKSAVIDLLREFRGYHVPSSAFEFCLLRIQGGILDLEDGLSNDWSPIRSDATIRRFKRLVRRLGPRHRLLDPRTWFAATGWNYDEYFANQFTELSNHYIASLVQASWVTDWPYPKADLGDFELFIRKVGRVLRVPRAYDFRVHLAFPDDFVGITRQYLNQLLSSNVGDDVETIVLHNAFEPFRPQRCLKFFAWAKCIIVDRDPRDMYVQQLSYRPMAVSAREFVLRYRTYREAARKFFEPDSRILRLRFEDIVLHYARTVAAVLEYLEEPPSVHLLPRRYFDPEASKKNIGLWRDYPRRDEIELIWRELRESCYD